MIERTPKVSLILGIEFKSVGKKMMTRRENLGHAIRIRKEKKKEKKEEMGLSESLNLDTVMVMIAVGSMWAKLGRPCSAVEEPIFLFNLVEGFWYGRDNFQGR